MRRHLSLFLTLSSRFIYTPSVRQGEGPKLNQTEIVLSQQNHNTLTQSRTSRLNKNTLVLPPPPTDRQKALKLLVGQNPSEQIYWQIFICHNKGRVVAEELYTPTSADGLADGANYK